MVGGLPPSYIFFLKCCYQPGCTHPRCKAEPVTTTWYPGGQTLTHLPLPLPDPDRPWGNSECATCKDFCSGHYKVQLIDTSMEIEKVRMPSSILFKEMFSQLKPQNHDITEDFVAKAVLLSNSDTLNYLAEVKRNRKRSAAKAAETRQKKKQRREEIPLGTMQ